MTLIRWRENDVVGVGGQRGGGCICTMQFVRQWGAACKIVGYGGFLELLSLIIQSSLSLNSGRNSL